MRICGVFILALASISMSMAGICTAGPGVWNEKNYGTGDSGKLPPDADVTNGVGPLDTICGNIANPTNGVDMYEIMITGTTFSATASDRNSSTLDPALFLFDSSGDALYSDESGVLSDLSVTPGLYYLAITSDGNDAKHNSHLIFTLGPGLLTPTYNNTGITGWSAGGNSSGEYIITLNGSTYAQTPEPAAIALVGIGLIGLGVLRRKPRK